MLWAECDGSDSAQSALSYKPEPSIVIRSGSGQNLHAYWPLRRPLDPATAEVANLRLAHAVGADRVCFDAARILRPPGSWNHKHSPAREVVAVRVEPAVRFKLDDVLARAPKVRRGTHRAALDRTTRRETRMATRCSASRRPSTSAGIARRACPRPGRKVRCPFHDDVRPSLHVYATARGGWSCFSCGRGGSIYDLAAEVWGTWHSRSRLPRAASRPRGPFSPPTLPASRCIER